MEIKIECKCGEELDIITIDKHTNGVYLIVGECVKCAETNYEAGEADAKQERL